MLHITQESVKMIQSMMRKKFRLSLLFFNQAASRNDQRKVAQRNAYMWGSKIPNRPEGQLERS
jgi:hypothetical protein